MKMKESDKKKIYYDLRNNKVKVENLDSYTNYKFGRYLVRDYYGCIDIRQIHVNPDFGKTFIRVENGEWDESIERNDAYDICTAAYYKSKGKEYDDPYKDRTANDEIRDLTKEYGKQLLKTAADFLPIDMPKYQALRTLVKLRRQYNQHLKEYYTK